MPARQTISPAVNGQADVFDRILFVEVARHCDAFQRKHGFAGFGRGFFNGKLHIAPDHHAGKFFLGGAGNLDGADALALAQDGAAVGHSHNLVEFMGDEEDALAFFFEASA